MAPTRDDLRDELLAVIGAASELPQDERQHLADVFLDRLDSDYRLVPRGEREPSRQSQPGSPFRLPIVGAWPLMVGRFLLIPLLATSAFVFVHPPIFLFAILLFIMLRSGWWRRGRHMYR